MSESRRTTKYDDLIDEMVRKLEPSDHLIEIPEDIPQEIRDKMPGEEQVAIVLELFFPDEAERPKHLDERDRRGIINFYRQLHIARYRAMQMPDD